MEFIGKSRKCTDAGLRAAADEIGCDEAVLRAVVSIEAGGNGFDSQGRPKALFEPHIFYQLLSQDKRQTAVTAGLAYRRWGTRPYPKESYSRIVAACKIDEECALQATSWGLPQILGRNYRSVGYRSAREMVRAFLEGEDVQLRAMARFIVFSKLDLALRRKDWATFAKGYNGPSYKTHGYHTKLAKAYAHFSGAKATVSPDPVTPVSKNKDHAVRLVQGSKRTGLAAICVVSAAPGVGHVVSSSSGSLSYGGIVALVFVSCGVCALLAAWRAFSRARSFR